MSEKDPIMYSYSHALAVRCLSVLLCILLLLACAYSHIQADESGNERPRELTESIAAIRSGNFSEAQAKLAYWLSRSDKRTPYFSEANYLMGQVMFHQREFEKAKNYHDQAINHTEDRTLKTLARYGRAECNYELGSYMRVIQQLNMIERLFRSEDGIPHDELMFKLGMANKKAGLIDQADNWFENVIELYSTTRYAALSRHEHSELGPGHDGQYTYWSLSYGSFKKLEDAEAAAQEFKEKGYKDVEVSSMRNATEGVRYRVFIGKFYTRNEAKVVRYDASLVGLKTSVKPRVSVEPFEQDRIVQR